MKEVRNEPLSARRSWAFFLGLGGVAFVLNTLLGPALESRFELSRELTSRLTGLILFAAMFATAAAMLRKEGRSFDWASLRARLRMRGLSRREWMLVLLCVLVVNGSYLALQFLAEPIANLAPAWVSAPYRRADTGDPSGDYLGLVLFAGLVFLNVTSEEVLWRGCLLPRQELAHGRRTWWIHGVQWTCFHWFQFWTMPMILPGALIYGWMCTRTRSMVPGLVLHFGLNGLGVILLAAQVMQ